jgi:NADPH-dependent 2,4-dienoyl-CoA reductase/sulfur reductase-like enzyme/nitrite reductase/ring-hydroxylating ferredoxin subunit
MSGEQQLSGPDLRQGVASSDVADGTPLLGHADGEPVLVVRRDGELFAIGATCTHYGGPLAEGLIVGETVRCPWHHACFSLRTGDAIRTPALNPVASWAVEERGGRVRVTGKAEPGQRARPALDSAAESPTPVSVVIVGGGAAGNAAAEELRRHGYAGPITMIDPDADEPYDRPNLSKDYLAGNAPEEWIPLHPRSFYDELEVELVLGRRVTALDTKGKRVTLDDGSTRDYGALLLATGAEPVRLPLKSDGGPPIRYLRTLADSRAIVAAAKDAKRAVVIGASFIGLEVAASLRARDVDVHVVGPEARPLERVLGPEFGDFIRRLHEEHGVVFHLGQTASAVDASGVTLADGQRIAADLVVVGVGVRPNLALAEQAGLALDRGVVVDEYLETSAPGVFAAGDIARFPEPRTGERIRVEHWVVAERQGQAAARNMLGRRERYADIPFFWSQHYDVQINYVGHAERWDAIDVDGSIGDRNCVVSYRRGGRTLAVATIFRDRESLEAELSMEQEAVRAHSGASPRRAAGTSA